jgi:16S rRNA (guanine527-N7)-methyltransferase
MRATLEAAATQLGLTLTTTQVDQLLAYLALLQKWNKVTWWTACPPCPHCCGMARQDG